MERIFKLALVTIAVFFTLFISIKIYLDLNREEEDIIIFERKEIKKEHPTSWEEGGMVFHLDDTTDVVIEIKMMKRSDTLIIKN